MSVETIKTYQISSLAILSCWQLLIVLLQAYDAIVLYVCDWYTLVSFALHYLSLVSFFVCFLFFVLFVERDVVWKWPCVQKIEIDLFCSVQMKFQKAQKGLQLGVKWPSDGFFVVVFYYCWQLFKYLKVLCLFRCLQHLMILTSKIMKKKVPIITSSLEVNVSWKCFLDQRREAQECWQMTHSNKYWLPQIGWENFTTVPLFPNWHMAWPNFLPRHKRKEGTTCAREKWAMLWSSVLLTGQWHCLNTDTACLCWQQSCKMYLVIPTTCQSSFYSQLQ